MPSATSTYKGTSKHSVVALTEGLVREFQAMGNMYGNKLGASVLCPAFVNTNIFKLNFFISLIGNFKSFADEAKMKMGLEIFNETAGCAACHILKAAGSEGNIGPNLDTVTMTVESVKEMVIYGLGVMPAFGEGGIS